jgi:hypothetical protein
MSPNAPQSALVGRQPEYVRLDAAIHNRESLLIWGPADAGKTAFVKTVIDGLSKNEKRNCIYWTGAASVRQLVGELVRLLYSADDPLVRKKVHDDGFGDTCLNRWLREQTTGRLKVLLYTATQKSGYWFFLDHLPPATHAMARLMKELIWRCKTPVYLLARGCSHTEIGYAWSIYFTTQYHISIGPLPESASHELLEQCVRRFGLASLDLEGFREDVLRLSGQLPGSIIKMCELAADPRYHYGDQVKVKLIHVDYLLRANAAYSQFVQGHCS